MFYYFALAVYGLGIKNGDVVFPCQSQKNGSRKFAMKNGDNNRKKMYAAVQIVVNHLTELTTLKSAYFFH